VNDALRRRAAKLRAAGVVEGIEQGAVYQVKDAEVRLPGGERRRPKPFRRVVIMQANSPNQDPSHPTVLVVPCSSSVPPGKFDTEFENHPNGFTCEEPTVFLSLVQPMLKSELGKREGKLERQDFEKLREAFIDRLLNGLT
jgi:hypothetical protein